MKDYVDYGKRTAQTLCSFGNHRIYGGRQAGSRAEHEAARFLEEEMRRIGLQDVKRESFPCDSWEFRDAALRVISPDDFGAVIRPYAYASGGTPPEGITAPLFYLGRGTKDNYGSADVRGGVVLIDIDMDRDWWIDAPTMEAALHGAAAVINSCSGGYAQYGDETMNCQDFCGPVSIPSVNITRRDAEHLKTLLKSGPVRVNLVVDNDVHTGGNSHNISGIVPGRNSEELVIIGDHYDSHFSGFQDNATAVGLTLALAKSVVESGYQPGRTLVFILHGAEEWGAVDTRYDWAVGAWNQVNRLHPEWSGRAVCYINFELTAYEADTSWYLASSAEMQPFARRFLETIDPPKGCYPGGIRRDRWSITPWSDEWSYSLVGIPAFLNGFMLKADGSFSDFIHTIYHSQYDTTDTWNGDVFAFNFRVFSRLLREMDGLPAVPLDFSVRGRDLLESLDEELMKGSGIDTKDFRDSVERFIEKGVKARDRAESLNTGRQPVGQARRFNASMLRAYRMSRDALQRFTWDEEPVFPHQPLQRNILVIRQAIDEASGGNGTAAAEKLAGIDLNYLAASFSREVFNRTMNQTLDPAAGNRQFWGRGRIVSSLDFFDEIHILMNGGNPGAVLQMLELKLEEQFDRLRREVNMECRALRDITEILETAAKGNEE